MLRTLHLPGTKVKVSSPRVSIFLIPNIHVCYTFSTTRHFTPVCKVNVLNLTTCIQTGIIGNIAWPILQISGGIFLCLVNMCVI